MYISKVSLVNYRNFRNNKFSFEKGVNTIIGENGSGKSNLFRAIRLILDNSLYRSSYNFLKSDFNRSLGDWRGHWIIISVTFSELSDDDAIQSLFLHSTGIVEVDKVEIASYNLIFRPNPIFRRKLSELQKGDLDGLDKLLSELTLEDYETKFTGRSAADFNNSCTYKEIVGDFETVEFPERIDSELVGVIIPNQLSVAKEVAFTFIKALRDVVSDLNSSRNNPLYKLLQSQSISEEELKPIVKSVANLNSAIENLDGVQTIRSDIKDTILESTGDTYSPASLSIKSSVSSDESKLFNSLNLFVAEPNESYEGDVREMSLGGVNIIYLSLKLLEYKYRKDQYKFANFILIEEPEAHIHTHIQKTLFDKIEFDKTQIIYSTHSPQISEVSNISKVNILSKKIDRVDVYQPSAGLNPTVIKKLERYLDAVRSNLLFAKGVLLVEGDAEEILIPALFKIVYGVSLDELGVSLINIRSTGFENVAIIFDELRIRRKCAIITDLDTAIGEDKGAEKKGAKRKIALDSLCGANDYLSAFYAKYTFEIDFLLDENSEKVIGLINEVYTDATTIVKSEVELKSKDVSVSGKRILTMATKQGKGWFAIDLASKIDHRTNIPKYILDAVSFAKGKLTESTFKQIIEHRFSFIKRDEVNSTLYDTLKNMLKDEKTELDDLFRHVLVRDDEKISSLRDSQ